MKHLKPAIYILLCLLPFTACRKNKDDDMSARTQMLTQNPWKLIKYEERDDPADPWIDETASYNACELDNLYSFSAVGSVQVTEGLTKCNPADPNLIDSGTWSFQNNETVIRVIMSQGTADLTIEILDGTTFRYTVSDPGFSIYLRFTLQH